MTQIGYLISARSLFDSAFRLDPLGNPWLLGGISLSVLLHLTGTFVTPVAETFRLAAFPAEWWPWILATLLPSFLAIETDKFIRARLARR